MHAVILAAGKGVRMGDLTKECPKPMLPLNGKPKLVYTLELLPDAIDSVIIVVGYYGEKIKEYFGASFAGRRIDYVWQSALNGSDGAVRLAKGKVSGRFLVVMGDDLYRHVDLEKLLQHRWALLACHTQRAEQFGLVSVDARGILSGVIERPHHFTHGLVNTGAYVLGEEYFSFSPVPISSTEYGLPQTLAAMREHYPTRVVTTDTWQPIGSPEDLQRAQDTLTQFLQ